MSGTKKPFPRQLALIALAAILAVLFMLDRFVLSGAPAPGVAARDPVDPDARPAAAGIPARATAAEPYLAAFSSYAEAVDRPVFFLTRRPSAPPPVARADQPVFETAAAPIRRPEIEVLGIALDSEGDSSALVRVAGQTRRVYTGEEIEGWRVSRIASDGLTIERDSESWRFALTPVQ